MPPIRELRVVVRWTMAVLPLGAGRGPLCRDGGLNGDTPEGFAAPNDHWHRHQNLCVKYGGGQIEVPFPADSDVTAAMCSGADGRLLVTTTWMVHAWAVPG